MKGNTKALMSQSILIGLLQFGREKLRRMTESLSEREGQLSFKKRILFWGLFLGIWSGTLALHAYYSWERNTPSIEIPTSPEEMYPYADSIFNDLKTKNHENIER